MITTNREHAGFFLTSHERKIKAGLAALTISFFHCGTTLAQSAGNSNIPGLPDVGADPWETKLFYENDTRYRGRDATGKEVGLSKFRNTLQLEASKSLEGGWKFHSVLRGTYDGVYSLNSSEYGKKAGGPVFLESALGPGGKVPLGGGLPLFGAGTGNNPNDGMRILGDRWNNNTSGFAFAVPVRPCDVDSRGCRDFGGYGNLTENELAFPEFNKKVDFVREAFVRNTITLPDGKDLFVKVGKQQVVWGRTDLFRVLDVINPVDYSRNNIYDELQDIRIPMWIAQLEYRMGASESMQDRNIQVIWNFDKFRPNNLGQCGTPNVILDAGCFFRGAANLWDNGGTIANFVSLSGTTAGPFAAAEFGPHQAGIRNVNLPKWNLANTQIGVKFEGVTQDGLNFSLNALNYRSQLPSLHGINAAAINPFTGAPGPIPGGTKVAFLPAADIYFPRISLIGGSLDFQVEALKASVRMEASYTKGEEFANTLREDLYSSNAVFRYVVGVDRPTFLLNDSRAATVSGQLFYTHIFDHQSEMRSAGLVGMPDWENNVIATLLIRQPYKNDRVNAQLIMARDMKGHAWAAAPSVDWLVTDDLTFTVGANIKGAEDRTQWRFDDLRSGNPYGPATAYAGQTGPGSLGLGGFEAFGRFRAGPVGAAWKENEIFVTAKYKF